MTPLLNPLRFFRGPPPEPLEPIARSWIEEHLTWLAEQFGKERLIQAPIIEPTPEFFPDRYDGSPDSARAMFERICGYMEVAPSLVDLQIFDESNRLWLVNDKGDYLPGAAGTYQEGEQAFVIRLEGDQLSSPTELAGTIAHELSHLRLMGENRCDPEAFDNELLTDLTATFFGFGIFLINAPRHWPSQLSYWPKTNVRRPEYMTLPMFAYALALIAEVRFEENPKWLRHLYRDARSEFCAAQCYLASRREIDKA